MKHPLCIPLFVALSGLAAAVNLSAQPSRASSGPEEAIELSPFSVTADAETSYGATQGTSGRLAMAYIDTPQATSIVTSELIRDAQLFNSNEVFKFVPGINQAIQLNGVQSIRGVRTGSTYTDGFSNGDQLVFDTSFADRVEIVKGPSSTSFGRGDPAGFINYVSKRPKFRAGTDVGLMVGTGNDRRNTARVTLDHNGLLTENRSTAYRLVFTHHEGAQTMDFSEFNRTGVQLSVAHSLRNGRGRLDVIGGYMQATNSGAEYNVSMTDEHILGAREARLLIQNNIVAVPFEVFDGDYAFGYDGTGIDQSIFRATAILDYKLSEHWRTRQAANFIDGEQGGRWAAYNSDRVFKAPDGTLMFNVLDRTRYNQGRRVSIQSDFLGDYNLDTIGGNLSVLFGGDYNDITAVDGGQIRPLTPQPLYAWDPGIRGRPFERDDEAIARSTKGHDWSAYAQAQLRLFDDKVQLTAAGRKIFQDSETFNRANGQITVNDTRSPLLPTYSILVKPLADVSIYATQSEHLEPASVIQEFGNLPPSDPRTSLTITSQPKTKLDEVGLRATLFDGNLTFSVAAFRLVSSGSSISVSQVEILPTGPNTFTRRVLSDSENKGWEFEMFGQLTDRLLFMLGGHTMAATNNAPILTKDYMGDTIFGYGTYRFGTSRYDGLSITAGWKTYFSGFTMVAHSTEPSELDWNRYPDNTTLVDLGISYGFRNTYEIYIKGTNIFHEKAVTIGHQAPGSGRQLFLGVNASF